MRPIVGTVAWALFEVWFAAVRELNKVLAHKPRWWNG